MTLDPFSKMASFTKQLRLPWVLLTIVCRLASVAEGQGSFRAAVYEHVDPSDPSMPLEDIMLASAETYLEQARKSAALGVRILVFPEYGLSGVSVPNTRQGLRPYLQVLPSVEPDPTNPWIPCVNNSTDFNVTILHQMSCAARDNAIVLVVNVGTVVECTWDPTNSSSSACPSDGAYQFNTDVVFGTDGAVLATYHKMNLYREPAFDRPPYPTDHVTTFATDFASFGLITCFDLLYHDPLITLVEQHGIRYVAMPTAWVDGLPFLTSVQSQMAWAIGLNVSILAANIQNSEDGYRGSGIYHGEDGFLQYIYGPWNSSRLIWADVPAQPSAVAPTPSEVRSAPHFLNYSGIIYDDISNYTFVALNSTSGSAVARHETLSCTVEYEFEAAVTEGIYVLTAYDGFITLGYGEYRLAVQTCALMWCPDADTDRCSQPPVTSTSRLLQLRLEGNFSTAYVYPSVLRADLQLVGASEWHHVSSVDADRCGTSAAVDTCDPEEKSEEVNRVQLITNPGFSHCPLVAGLYGRLYDKDND